MENPKTLRKRPTMAENLLFLHIWETLLFKPEQSVLIKQKVWTYI